jgi:hypothetical protein
MEGHGCELAVRIDGKSYFVDGSSIDSHGDACQRWFCYEKQKWLVKWLTINSKSPHSNYYKKKKKGLKFFALLYSISYSI